MRSISLAAVLLVSALALAGCAGPYGGYGSGYGGCGSGYGGYGSGYGGGGYGNAGIPQPYAFDPGMGGAYGQPYQANPYGQYGQPYGYYNGGGAYYTDPTGSGAKDKLTINERLKNQENRIQQALNSGKLNQDEYKRLEDQQARIQAARKRMLADGPLTQQERARLNTMLHNSNQNIYRLSHNQAVAQNNGQTAATRAQRQTGAQRNMAQARPMAQGRPAMQGRAAAQPRAAAQSRANGGWRGYATR